MIPTERDFDLSASKILLNVWISVAAATASCLLCLLVLVAAGYIYSKPRARHAINRVSFRLLLWSMVFEVFYDMAFIAVGVEGGVPNAVCATGVYFMMSTLGVVNYLCTCIAINLMLIVCFKINPLEKELEKWYVGMSILLGMGIPIVPAALDHFGWDPILDVCWIKAKSDSVRLKYFILDLYLWQTLSCLIAALAVVMTLFSLFHQRRQSAKTLDITIANLDIEHVGGDGNVRRQLKDRFIKIAILISLYPISLIFVNGFILIGDLYISAQGGVHSQAVYILYCIYYFLYGGRGIAFALLGIFVDPCLRRGWEAVRSDKSVVPLPQDRGDKASLMEILGAPTPVPAYELRDDSEGHIGRARQDSKSSIELVAALSRLPAHGVGYSPRLSKFETFTRSFSGVRTEALPAELTDEVDVHVESPTSEYEALTVEYFEPLEPDLPDPGETRRRHLKAVQVENEDALRAFEDQQAQL